MVRVLPTPGGSACLDGGARTRQSLLTGASLTALGLAAAVAAISPSPAHAQITISTSEAGRDWSSGGDLTITPAGMVSAPGAVGITVSADAGTLTNSGTITGFTAGVVNGGVTLNGIANTGAQSAILSAQIAIHNLTSGWINTISNEGLITGATGIKNDAGAMIGTIINTGTITGGGPIYNLGLITSIANGAQGVITDGFDAIANGPSGSITAITNQGMISGNRYGVRNDGTIGSIDNMGSSATITGGSHALAAIYNTGSIGAISNEGLINAATGIKNDTGGTIGTITNIGTITGGGPIHNLGLISSISNGVQGVINNGFDAIANDASGSITALTNQGMISGSRYGVRNDGSIGSIDNMGPSATIMGTAAIYNTGSIGAISNEGSIGGGAAIHNDSSGRIGTITNQGALIADIFGIRNDGSIGLIANLGASATIRGTTAIYNTGSIGAITNQGLLNSQTPIKNDTTGRIGTITNTGSITDGPIYNLGSIVSIINAVQGVMKQGVDAIANYASGSITGITNQGKISSNRYGIGNDGFTGSIYNMGASATIGGRTAAINNTGSIGSIRNEGIISAKNGLLNLAGGSIGTIGNSGTITGSIAAISNAGSIGSFTNTGVIAGQIVNSSGVLSITGGSDSTYGTLTGFGGAAGTITNTHSNLILTGNQVLDDNVNLGAFGLSSSGSLQVNRSIAVTGNFVQAGGSLRFGVTSASDYGKLAISGAALISGAQVMLIPLVSNVIATGQSYSVVSAAGGLTASSITSTVVGYAATASAGDGNTLVLTVGAADASSTPTPAPTPTGTFTQTGIDAGGQAVALGAALDKIVASNSPASQAFAALVIPVLNQLNAVQQAKAVSQLAPSSTSAQMSVGASASVGGAVVSHTGGFSALARGEQYASLGSDDYYGSANGGRGMWGKVIGGGANRSADGGAPYDANFVGAVFGADVVKTDQVLVGGAFSWVGANAYGEGDFKGSSTRLNTYQLTAYATAAPKALDGRLTLDAQVGYAINRYNQQRQIDFLGARATTKYDGQQALVSATAAYAFKTRMATVSPYFGLSEAHLVNQGYSETGAGVADLSVKSMTTDTFQHDLGVKVEGAFGLWGGQVLPSAKLGWTHTYDNGPLPISGVLGGVTFTSASTRAAADGAAVGAGAVFRSNGRYDIGVEYQGDIRKNFQSHTGSLRVSMKF